MVPAYDRFMRPLLDDLAAHGRSPYAEVAQRVGQALKLSATDQTERVAWDGMTQAEARVRKAAHDLEKAGLVARSQVTLEITASGRAALATLPERLNVSILTKRFPAFASFREEYLARRGA